MEATEAQLAARQSAETAKAVVDAQAEADLIALQEKIDGEIYDQIAGIHRAIEQAASEGMFAANYTTSERIASRINPPETVEFIKTVTDMITTAVTEQLVTEGYKVHRDMRSVEDYRDRDDAPPEYYDTHFTVSWPTAH